MVLIRLVQIICASVAYFLTSFFIHLRTRDDVLRRQRFSRNACRFSKIVCRILNIKIEVKNKPADTFVGLIVGNHLGFVDILAMCGMMPNLFITSQEMHETPVLGL